MKIIFSCDHAGYILKNDLIVHYPEGKDLGTYCKTPVDYPTIVKNAVEYIQKGYLGVFICGTGIGMSIAANRYNFIRAALCRCPYEAKMAKQHNNANVLCLGARVIGSGIAKECIDVFLNSTFDPRHQKRINLLG